MRTTLTIDDDIYAIARNVADLKHLAIGAALSELARRGLERNKGNGPNENFPVFGVSESAPPFGLDDVKSAEDEA
ncbi:MAG: CopG family transcriptional regulator [Spirochaetae bacterium HGW-Spirochaetae-7]|jgi:hypothetical protein|nr:MAG: CopG family transcriptional regulator [Spirochaetae bacterium HGW-Spirochaetae-7]